MEKRTRRRATSFHGILVLQAMAQGLRYGFDIMRETGLPSGTVYPILRRFEEKGKVLSTWEANEEAKIDGRPRRRLYEMTRHGEIELAEGLERIRAQQKLLEAPARE